MKILKLHSYGAVHQNDSVRKPAFIHAAPLWTFHAEIEICGIEADLMIKATNLKNLLMQELVLLEVKRLISKIKIL